MRKEKLEIIKSIIIVLILTLTTILICTKIAYRNYIYTFRYLESENLYSIYISDKYQVKIDIQVVCTEDKCQGNYKSPISVNVDIDKTLVKKLIKEFELPKNGVLDANENTITEEQKELLNKIIR